MPIGGGKGGSDFDPKGKSDDEVMRFCQSFMTELYRHLGEYTDVPAGDIGVGRPRDRLPVRPVQADHQPLRVGRPDRQGPDWGGSLVRREATGYGAVYFVDEMLKVRGEGARGQDLRGLRLGQRRDLRDREDPPARRQGRRLLRLRRGDPPQGRDRPGDAEAAQGGRAAADRATTPSEHRDAEYHPGGNIWDIPCDVAMPSATQNELDEDAARRLVANGCIAVGEGANMPTTPEGVKVFLEAGVAFGPGKAANAGGVATSALEMQQNASRDAWTFEHTEQRLARDHEGHPPLLLRDGRGVRQPRATTSSAPTSSASSASPRRWSPSA